MVVKRIRFAIISLATIAVCIGLFAAIASRLVVHPVNFSVPQDYKMTAELALGVEVIEIDPLARTFTVDWYPQTSTLCVGNTSERVIDIYLDRGIIDPAGPAFSILPPYSPMYRFNISAYCIAQTTMFVSFRTTTKLLNSRMNLGFQGPLQSTIQNYPFDEYFATFNVYGLDVSSNKYVRMNISHSFGEVVNFQVSLMKSNAELPEWLLYTLKVERSMATKIFVIMVGITNWLTAVAFMLISISTFVYRSHRIYSEMFVVPAGAVFAFSTIRAGFPGAPSGFGATIDLFTILPVLVIMSFCSFFLLLVILYRRVEEYTSVGASASNGEGHSSSHGRKDISVDVPNSKAKSVSESMVYGWIFSWMF